MAISVTCPKCGKTGQAPDQAVGKKLTCRACQTTFLVGERRTPTGDGGKPLVLVGDPHAGLDALAQRLRGCGIAVGPVNQPADGQPVFFCVSLADGPVPAMLQAVKECASHSPVPLGLIGLNASTVDDPDLRELSLLEVREELCKNAPRLFADDSADDLPVLLDNDADLAAKVRSAATRHPVRGAGEADVRQGQAAISAALARGRSSQGAGLAASVRKWSRGVPRKIVVYGNGTMPDHEFLKYAIIAILGLKLVPRDGSLDHIPLITIEAHGRHEQDGFHRGIRGHVREQFPSTEEDEVLVVSNRHVPGGLLGLAPVYDED